MEKIQEVFFSHSPKMEKLSGIIGEIADVDVPVLIKGESGSGKEIVANAIHVRSRRQDKPLIKVNCAAIPQSLLESELFGFDKGAFTGAHLKKPGKFELANGGTIILNDIGEIDISIQAKLLQVLQDGEFSRLGGEGDIMVDTRVITTSKDDLERSIGNGRFREDLFHRINVISLSVPPLRDRKEQIFPLTHFFLDTNRRKYGKPAPSLSPQTLEYFQEYDWPGNVRELENIVKGIILFGEEQVIQGPLKNILSARMPPRGADLHTDDPPRMKGQTLKRIGKEAAEVAERECLAKALQETHWNRRDAACILQISYKALLYKIKKYRLDETNINKLREELGWPIQPGNRSSGKGSTES
jgi:two-component system response regulator AtoC